MHFRKADDLRGWFSGRWFTQWKFWQTESTATSHSCVCNLKNWSFPTWNCRNRLNAKNLRRLNAKNDVECRPSCVGRSLTCEEKSNKLIFDRHWMLPNLSMPNYISTILIFSKPSQNLPSSLSSKVAQYRWLDANEVGRLPLLWPDMNVNSRRSTEIDALLAAFHDLKLSQRINTTLPAKVPQHFFFSIQHFLRRSLHTQYSSNC